MVRIAFSRDFGIFVWSDGLESAFQNQGTVVVLWALPRGWCCLTGRGGTVMLIVVTKILPPD